MFKITLLIIIIILKFKQATGVNKFLGFSHEFPVSDTPNPRWQSNSHKNHGVKSSSCASPIVRLPFPDV